MQQSRQFCLGNWQYDYNSGAVTSEQKNTVLRAKSNEVLFYLISNSNQILSKTHLLETIWDDVNAQEHVLFQSIKEIRQAFEGELVIKTHPRKGYEWVMPVSPLETDPPYEVTSVATHIPEKYAKGLKHKKNLFILSTLFIVGALLFLSWSIGGNTESPAKDQSSNSETTPAKFVELVITPVKVVEQDNLLQWVPIGAMDMLIKKLQNTAIQRESGMIMTVSTEDVLEAMHRAQINETLALPAISRALRHVMGEITSLHTEIYGSPMEYTLRYSLIDRYDTQQGIISGESVIQLLNQLARKLPGMLQMQATTPYVAYEERFANDAFIFGLSHYYQGEFATAENYFNTAINAGDSYPQSRRYLAKTIAAQGNLKRALLAAQNAIAHAQKNDNTSEILRSRFELGVLQWHLGQHQLAEANISATQDMAQQAQDLLYLAYAIELLGHLAIDEERFEDANQYYQEALDYHRGFQCPYGLSTNYINLSRVAELQSRDEQSTSLLQDALQVASDNELGYFEIRIQLLLARQALQLNQGQQAKQYLVAAQKLLTNYPNEATQRIIDNWPESVEEIR